MKETTSVAMPSCFHRWCDRFNNVFKTKAQKTGFREYIGGLLGESDRKNLSQIANNTVGHTYHKLRHFLVRANWSVDAVNERRLQVMWERRQTKPSRSFALIIDDSGHRKSGNFTAGVGRQYIGEIGKTDNGVVVVTTHLYDGVKSLPLDIALYQKADSFPKGKKDPEFVKKPDLAMSLVDQCLSRGHQPEIVLIDGGYGNNTSFLNQLEKRSLTYIGGLAKNRKVIIKKQDDIKEEIRLDKLAESIPQKAFNLVQLSTKNAREVWVATLEVEISRMSGQKTIAIVMNAKSFSEATDINYYITNREDKYVTPEWIYSTYSQRNWVEVFYREAKGWLGLREYQVRDKISLKRHFILVFCAYTFIIWHQLTGGIRRRWANKPLNTFTDTLEAFRTAISYRFVEWLDENIDVFTAHKESLGFVWA